MYYCLLRELVYHLDLNYTKFRLASLEVSSEWRPTVHSIADERGGRRFRRSGASSSPWRWTAAASCPCSAAAETRAHNYE